MHGPWCTLQYPSAATGMWQWGVQAVLGLGKNFSTFCQLYPCCCIATPRHMRWHEPYHEVVLVGTLSTLCAAVKAILHSDAPLWLCLDQVRTGQGRPARPRGRNKKFGLWRGGLLQTSFAPPACLPIYSTCLQRGFEGACRRATVALRRARIVMNSLVVCHSILSSPFILAHEISCVLCCKGAASSLVHRKILAALLTFIMTYLLKLLTTSHLSQYVILKLPRGKRKAGATRAGLQLADESCMTASLAILLRFLAGDDCITTQQCSCPPWPYHIVSIFSMLLVAPGGPG